MYTLLSGAVAALALIAGIAFLRSFARTRDRFFVYFAAAFWLLGTTQLGLGLSNAPELNRPLAYVPRLFVSLLILVAIWDKNRGAHKTRAAEPPVELDDYQRRRAAR